MATRSEMSAAAVAVVGTYLDAAVAMVDAKFGPGASRERPDLVGAIINACATEVYASVTQEVSSNEVGAFSSGIGAATAMQKTTADEIVAGNVTNTTSITEAQIAAAKIIAAGPQQPAPTTTSATTQTAH